MKTLIKKHNHSESCKIIKVSRRSQKVETYLANGGFGLPFFNAGLAHTFAGTVGHEVVVMLGGKRLHRPEFAYDIVRIHSLMICTDLIEFSIIGDTKTPLLRCLIFISKPKAGEIITTGPYMNYQTFSILQFRPLLKKSFHSVHIDLTDTSDEKVFFVSVGITRFVLMFRRASKKHFQP